MEENKVKIIENKKPVYIPEPLVEFIPTDLSTINFDKYFEPAIECFKRMQLEAELISKRKPEPNRDIGYIFAPSFLGGIL